MVLCFAMPCQGLEAGANLLIQQVVASCGPSCVAMAGQLHVLDAQLVQNWW